MFMFDNLGTSSQPPPRPGRVSFPWFCSRHTARELCRKEYYDNEPLSNAVVSANGEAFSRAAAPTPPTLSTVFF
eukprot:scaffold9371_cov211-Amphora_coffeaeformis.AAC.18